MGVLQQVRSKAHVPAVNVLFTILQLEQKLYCARAMIGVHEYDFDTCSMYLLAVGAVV